MYHAPPPKQNSQPVSRLDTATGLVKSFVDLVRPLEQLGQIYNLTHYLEDAIIIVRNSTYPMLVEVFSPHFLFYFQFIIERDPKTLQTFITDVNVIYPITSSPKTPTDVGEDVGEGE
ncbi:hypothetical protein D878_gp21 [Sulfolobales Mexican rudivirus 1]|uniref:Uncharacterized protein n=1 Tax=Sulfolobales Mexican rod-shaped virus 1 TaxID=2848122 RepID=K4NZB2_9VIRU|nr:hypothetical protein D878_gp21 [Sulfolobales Mexican rudivirus 1]AFV51248.1 hypothetical protein [Sulfolobales Mexican rod-shaped virus 1]